jgi:Bacterial Ig domain
MRRALPIATGLLLLLAVVPASAQTDGELTIEFHRDFGYAAGSEIQGAFSLTADGPGNLVRVDYYLDNQLLGSATQSPFKISFNTGDQVLGRHTFAAVGTTADGSEIRSLDRTLEFVSPDEGWQMAGRIALPIIGIVILMSLLGTIAPMLLGRRTKFRLGEYSAAGGAVCPRCGMPFSRHPVSLNMVFGKLERCPHCGKLSIVSAASVSALRQAEARWQADSHQGELQPESRSDRLREQIDESRYEE